MTIWSDQDLRNIKMFKDVEKQHRLEHDRIIEEERRALRKLSGGHQPRSSVALPDSFLAYLGVVGLCWFWFMALDDYLGGESQYLSALIWAAIIAIPICTFSILKSFFAAFFLTAVVFSLPAMTYARVNHLSIPFGYELALFTPVVIGIMWVAFKLRR